MKILCKHCNKEIEIIQFQLPDSEKQLSCNWCHTTFIIRPKVGAPGLDVIFDLDKYSVRSCINCGKKFYSVTTESIPTCPACKSEPPPKERQLNKYYILKASGKRLGPYSLEETGSLIIDGSLGENEIIETPEREALKVHKVPELTPYLKDYYLRIRKREKVSSSKTNYVKSLHLEISPSLVFAFIICLAIGGWIYLILKKTPTPEKRKDLTKDLLKAWSQKYPELPESFDYYYKKGSEEFKTYTESSCESAKTNFIKAFIKNRGGYSALSFISLSLSCLYDYQRDEKILNLGLDLSELVINESPTLFLGFLAKGDILFKKSQLIESKNFIEKAFNLNPENSLVLLLHGRELLHSEETGLKGEEILLKNLKLDPMLSYANLLLGQNALMRERFGEALKQYNKRLRKSPQDPSALFHRASLYIMLKKYGEAREDLINSIKIQPNFDRARLLLSQILYRIYGQSKEAFRNVKIAMREGNNLSKSELIDAHLLLSNIHLQNGRPSEAIKECDEGLSLRPTDPYLKLNKINGLLSTGQEEIASPIIQDFLEGDLDYPGEINLHLALLFEKHKMKNEAFEILTKYTANQPKSFLPFAKLASFYLSKKDGDKAKKILVEGMVKTALFIQSEFLPDLRSPELKINPKEIGNELSKTRELTMNPELIETAKALLILQGIPGQTAQSNYQSSKSILEKVLRRDQSIALAYLILGYVNIKTGKFKKALELLKKAKEMDINNVSAKVALSMVYIKLGQSENGKQELKETIANEWLKFIILYEMGNADLISKNKAEAIKTYRKGYEAQKNFHPIILTLFRSENEE